MQIYLLPWGTSEAPSLGDPRAQEPGQAATASGALAHRMPWRPGLPPLPMSNMQAHAHGSFKRAHILPRVMLGACLLCTGRKLLERWVISYSAQGSASNADARGEQLGHSTQQQQQRPMSSRQEPAAIYKRMVIALRSLFSYVRMLPAYRLFRACTVRTLVAEHGCSHAPDFWL